MTRRSLRVTVLLAAVAIISGCAALPDDAPIVENLDPETGVTVARLGRPLELYRETARQDSVERFAFLGPFETNQMGKRELFLWVAVPLENPAGSAQPTILIDNTALELGDAGKAADFAGLRSSPYHIPTPWLAMYYYRIDADVITRLAAARDLRIKAVDQAAKGPLELEYAGAPAGDQRLAKFAAR
jgi:hypothetical protein